MSISSKMPAVHVKGESAPSCTGGSSLRIAKFHARGTVRGWLAGPAMARVGGESCICSLDGLREPLSKRLPVVENCF
jgi:hypothetical protein